ncbi:MAG: NPCBM/NEW2 domain-containing protein [Pirellulales bacterium]|nr:NPCBM/NEW2 domain-containing protein [Pirellulales bacterium]
MIYRSLLLVLIATNSLLAQEPEFRVIFGEKEVVSGLKLNGWDRLDNPAKLDETVLFTDTKKIRYLERLGAAIKRTTSFIEFHNHDLLPGQVIGFGAADPVRGIPSHYLVHVNGNYRPFAEADGTIRVKAAHVRRIVFQSSRITDTNHAPGTVILRDESLLQAQNMRWSDTGLRALSENQSITANWVQLSAVFPNLDPDLSALDAVLADHLAPANEATSRIARYATIDGGSFTFRESMVIPLRRENNLIFHTLQPAWSLDAIRILFDSVAHISYRSYNQLPLSSLPANVIEERNFTGFQWPWKRNQNRTGNILTASEMISDIGVSTHSYSKIAFRIPPKLVTRFMSYLGIDQSAEGGGCAKVKVSKRLANGSEAVVYQSGFLLGTYPYTIADVSGLTDAEALIIETDFGHDGRPTNADPFDIRDDVSWVLPYLTLDLNVARQANDEIYQYISSVQDWQIPASLRARVELTSHWDSTGGRWLPTISWKAPFANVAETPVLEFHQKTTLRANNSWLVVSASANGVGDKTTTIEVQVNGEPLTSIMNGNVSLTGQVAKFDARHWLMGDKVGQEVDVSIRVMPREAGTFQPQGITFAMFGLQPTVTGLPASGQLPEPDVPLSSLTPLKFTLPGHTEMPMPGLLKEDTPLTVRSLKIPDGYVFPGRSEIVYELKPEYSHLEMILGLADGSTAVGTFEVLVDDLAEPIWTSKELFDPGLGTSQANGYFSRQTQGASVRIPIPTGHTSITIRSGTQTSIGLLGNAGFRSN